MNTPANPTTYPVSSFTSLELVFLFRGVHRFGLDSAAFPQISNVLRDNSGLKRQPTFDAQRLSAEALQKAFLHLVGQEIRADNVSTTPGPDGPLSPASKKRRLEALPLPSWNDVHQHVDKIQQAYDKVYDSYVEDAVQAIDHLEEQYKRTQAELEQLELAEARDAEEAKQKRPHSVEDKGAQLNGAPDSKGKSVSAIVNGVHASPKVSPKPSPRLQQSPLPHVPHQHPRQHPQKQPQQQPLQRPQQLTPQPHVPQVSQLSQPPQPPQPPQLPQLPQLQQPLQSPQPLHQVQPPQHGHVPQQGQLQLQQGQPSQPGLSQQGQGQPPQHLQQSQQAQQGQPPQHVSTLQQPHLPPHVQQSQQAQPPLRPLQPLLPHLAPRQDARNGLGSPHSQHASLDKPAPTPRPPSLNHPPMSRSPQLGHPDVSRVPSVRPPEPPKSLSGSPQVLQAPQGVPSFQPLTQSPGPTVTPDGLQRPDGIARAQHSPGPLSANSQLPPSQSQLKWEPPYQPNSAGARPPLNLPPSPHGPNVFPPPPHMVSGQRPPQAPSPLQTQHNRPVPPQVLHPPHTHSTGQFVPLQPTPVRPAVDTANRQPPPVSSPGPNVNVQSPFHPGPYHNYSIPPSPHAAQPQPHTLHAPQHGATTQPPPVRGPAVASPTPLSGAPLQRPNQGLAAPSQQRPQLPLHLQAPSPYQQASNTSVAPSPTAVQQNAYSSPYHPPRPAPVERIHQRAPVTTTPVPPARFGPAPSAPQTPAAIQQQSFVISAKMTKWKTASTPSTPKPGVEFRLGWDVMDSPAVEPISPILGPAASPLATPQGTQKKVQEQQPTKEAMASSGTTSKSRASQSIRDATSPSPASAGVRNKTRKDAEEVALSDMESEAPRIKDEAMTPRPTTETGDNTGDDVVPDKPNPARSVKRKRDEFTPASAHSPGERQSTEVRRDDSMPPNMPNVVLWTRSFHKVSGSAMESIVGHRSANMFAAPIREKDAPGYHKVIKQPQDLKTIRSAIAHGNKAAAQAAAALPGGDPGGSCWLPRTEELVPPKSIINSGQLDRELSHIFANCIMYNPDPWHGPGPAFLPPEDDSEGQEAGAYQDNVVGYKVDEFGIVNDARAMFIEVEQHVSELRSAEKRSAPPGHGMGMDGLFTGTSTRQASVAAHGDGTKDDTSVLEEQDEQTATETENNDGRSKRRRTGRA
ncbi:putative vegetative cell wall protein gp1 precursor [Triangularia verruculosa]|uniref:Vegetative cell wall protein gp1 n=1 Tax=Triangularia verruculosa TaxID=2587418 RepID=A0AAN6XG04_9PEZI|nr:putative vegetative cell wall protein gp1 precursor [Triangularia verruculosa]